MSRSAVLLLKGSFSRLLLSPPPPNRISLSPSYSSTIARFFSSEADFSSDNLIRREINPTATVSPKDDASIVSPKDAAATRSSKDDASSDVSDVSTEALKEMIGNYLAGKVEVLPDIFEAILERKLSGKHEETDDELMVELRSNMPRTSELGEEDEDLASGDDSDTSDEDSDYYSD